MTAEEAIAALQLEAAKLDALISLMSEAQKNKSQLAQIVALVEANTAKLAVL